MGRIIKKCTESIRLKWFDVFFDFMKENGVSLESSVLDGKNIKNLDIDCFRKV